MSANSDSTAEKLDHGVLAARCHDITVSLNGSHVAQFDQMVLFGMAVRLALHLRGIDVVSYELLKLVGLHLLHIPPTSLKNVVELLGEVEFVKIDRQGKTIRSIIPTVPYYEDLFDGIGEAADNAQLSEPEALTLRMVDRLSRSPIAKSTLLNWGDDKKLVAQMLDIAREGGYLIERRARGKDIVVSPMYFPENAGELADLTAGYGGSAVAKVMAAISENQGWPIGLIEKVKRIGSTELTPEDVAIVKILASDAINPAPAINTSHHGTNHFIFGPRPGTTRLHPTKRHIYEAAMALVAAVRQGQLLPAKYAIRSPLALLRALLQRKWLKANTEAFQQYQALAVMRLGRLVPSGSGFFRFELIDTEENIEAVEMAIQLVSGSAQAPSVDEDVVLGFHKGQEYVESLVARRTVVKETKVALDNESTRQLEDFFLKGES